MKTVLKSLVVGLMVFALSFSPALMGIAKAGGINYEGFGSYKKNNSGGYDDYNHGAMLNFSFGGPKDYKKSSSLQDIYKASLTQNQKIGLGLGVGLAIFLLIMNADDDDCVSYYPPNGESSPNLSFDAPVVGPGYCESGEYIAISDRRLKEDIIKVGDTHQGLPLYTFRYIGKDITHIGVMAQDVLKVYPEAVLIRNDGYYMVDYGKLGLAHLLLL